VAAVEKLTNLFQGGCGAAFDPPRWRARQSSAAREEPSRQLVHDLSHRLLIASIIAVSEGPEGLLVMVEATRVKDLDVESVPHVITASAQRGGQDRRSAVFSDDTKVANMAHGEGVSTKACLSNDKAHAANGRAAVVFEQEAERIMRGAVRLKDAQPSRYTSAIFSNRERSTEGDGSQEVVHRPTVGTRRGAQAPALTTEEQLSG